MVLLFDCRILWNEFAKKSLKHILIYILLFLGKNGTIHHVYSLLKTLIKSL